MKIIVKGFEIVVKVTEAAQQSCCVTTCQSPALFYVYFLFFSRLPLQWKKINTFYPARVNLLFSVSGQ